MSNHRVKRRGEDGYLRPAHSIELRRNKFNIDLEENRVFSVSAEKRYDTRKRSL